MKEISGMSDEELKESYFKGKDWLRKNEQVTGTNKNAQGEKYDGTMYVLGLKRIEAIEKEFEKRNLNYAE